MNKHAGGTSVYHLRIYNE